MNTLIIILVVAALGAGVFFSLKSKNKRKVNNSTPTSPTQPLTPPPEVTPPAEY
jgi:flagellar basal body-associated protein FliL